MTTSLLSRERDILPTGTQQDTPAYPSLAYQSMATELRLCDDLYGGTKNMRVAGTDHLPQEDQEKDPAYTARLAKSFLHPMFEDTVNKLAGAPFSKPVTLKLKEGTELPKMLAMIEDDADGEGADLSQFAHEVFKGGVQHGLRFMVVDFPGEGGLSLGQEKEGAVHPFFVDIRPHDFVGWDTETDPVTKREVLSEVRIRGTTSAKKKGHKYVEEMTEVIRSIRRGSWSSVRRKSDSTNTKEEWAPDGEGEWSMAGAPDKNRPPIPLVCFYTSRTGKFRAVPPLRGLAWLNVAHWQSYSDQRNILRFIRVGVMLGAGFSTEEKDTYSAVTVGANKIIFAKDPLATIRHTTYEGTAVDAGRLDLKDLEDRGEILGLQPLVEKGVSATATKAGIDESKSQTAMKRWIRACNNALLEAYKFAAMWANEVLPEDFGVEIFSDFSIGFRAQADLDQLLKARVAREITRKVFLQEIQTRGLISTDHTIDEMVQELDDEADEAFAKEQERFGDEGDEGDEEERTEEEDTQQAGDEAGDAA